jgi:hypothetical protein
LTVPRPILTIVAEVDSLTGGEWTTCSTSTAGYGALFRKAQNLTSLHPCRRIVPCCDLPFIPFISPLF